MSPIAFTGSPTVEMLRRSPPVKRGLGNLIVAKEGPNGRSHMTCLQDMLVALVPRAMISRSKAEGFEIGFLEILESILIYYSVPLIGGPLFKKLVGRMGSKNFDVKDLTRPLSELKKRPEAQMKHLLPAKSALILSALTLTGIGGEYLINYSKNLMTAHYFKMDKYSDIVNLSNGQMPSDAGSSEVVKKAWNRTYQTLGVCAALLASAVGLARFGHKLPAWILNGPVKDSVKAFDFNFTNGAFGLTKKQIAAYMALSIPAYLDSARDKLERWEAGSRLALILPYLLFGQDWLEKLIREKFPAITASAGDGRLTVKTLDILAREKIQETAAKMGVQLPQKPELWTKAQYKPVLDKAAQDFQVPLTSKIAHVLIPLGVGVVGTGFLVGLLNQYWTKRRFHQATEETKPSVQPVQRQPAIPIIREPAPPQPTLPKPGNGVHHLSSVAPLPTPNASSVRIQDPFQKPLFKTMNYPFQPIDQQHPIYIN